MHESFEEPLPKLIATGASPTFVVKASASPAGMLERCVEHSNRLGRKSEFRTFSLMLSAH